MKKDSPLYRTMYFQMKTSKTRDILHQNSYSDVTFLASGTLTNVTLKSMIHLTFPRSQASSRLPALRESTFPTPNFTSKLFTFPPAWRRLFRVCNKSTAALEHKKHFKEKALTAQSSSRVLNMEHQPCKLRFSDRSQPEHHQISSKFQLKTFLVGSTEHGTSA